MRIGDFARAGNVSLRALRFYEQGGLLSPAHVNPENGYRHYEPRQLPQLHQIGALKEMGFSLQEIHRLLARMPATGELREIFREKRDALLKRMQEDEGRLQRIEARLRRLEDKSEDFSGEVTLSAPRPAWIVSLRERIHRYEEAEGMFEKLEKRFDPGVFRGKRGALWHTCAGEGRTIDCEVFRFLKRPVNANHGLQAYEMPSGAVASVFHAGGDLTLNHSYRALTKWLAASPFHLSGPKREIYWVEAGPGAASESLTEIQFPLGRARGTGRGERRPVA